MKNTFIDVHNHLMEQLERLNDESLTDDQLNKEITRTEAITKVCSTISENAKVMLKAEELKLEYAVGRDLKPIPSLAVLTGDTDNG